MQLNGISLHKFEKCILYTHFLYCFSVLKVVYRDVILDISYFIKLALLLLLLERLLLHSPITQPQGMN